LEISLSPFSFSSSSPFHHNNFFKFQLQCCLKTAAALCCSLILRSIFQRY